MKHDFMYFESGKGVRHMKRFRRAGVALTSLILMAVLAGCGSEGDLGQRVIRIGHNQATDHPTHLALLEFEEFVEERLGIFSVHQ